MSAISDEQVQAPLEGGAEVVDEVVRINAEARDQALGYALLAIAAIGLIGLVAAFLLPRDKRPRSRWRRGLTQRFCRDARSGLALNGGAFGPQEGFFHGEAAAIAVEGAIAADDAVAGDEEGPGVGGHDAADSASGAGAAGLLGEPGVAAGLAEGTLAHSRTCLRNGVMPVQSMGRAVSRGLPEVRARIAASRMRASESATGSSPPLAAASSRACSRVLRGRVMERRPASDVTTATHPRSVSETRKRSVPGICGVPPGVCCADSSTGLAQI